ncbi:MAG: dihydropteroate synthase [Spirochaetae bacterium HGW-Spirochaetae-7]|jgi:dihydropteroate synthase|nr:MAG: dihydropteroate synthase [Spirochaetae bacterium HGW-Spirochaetae-7]
MGVVNVTPDSFWADSRVGDSAAAIDVVSAMVAAGAAIIDVGGESTRPGAGYVGAEEEAARVVPVIEAIRSRWGVAISVDTRKASVAAAALDAGADIVNDIAALGDDEALGLLCAARGVPVVLMHKRGIPANMQAAPEYADCVAEVRDFLVAAAGRAIAMGIAPDRIVIDPGIGFGKRLEDNIALLSRLDELAATGYPVLVGLSRKSFIGMITGAAPADRLPGSLAAACAARSRGAVIFRVHDVAETVAALAVFDASTGAMS